MPEKVKSNELTPEKEIVKPKAIKKVKTFLNKVVIRKLPPNLTSEEFLEIISPIPDYSDYYFVKADWSLGAEATSRAYIEFKNQEDIFIFKDKFDEYVFVDNVRGTEYPAIVEFAPFQNLPKSRARKDKHVNSIENEQHFLNFLEMLKKSEDAENQKVEPKLEYSYQIKDDKKITSTPLLEFIAASKEEKREAKKKKIEDKKKAREEEK
ncbi:hypothetical protein PVAND_009070 [Polypedilum vanderplanki]|uniref:UPF3 domain-containing protein n=1 Tax=Polypedilum vanderplanki TaxID=319348 RepID=A0A9J6CCM8_POLVA|nr:hypothetical protein PVAND_009070 [Polypedilum vanderplanki]